MRIKVVPRSTIRRAAYIAALTEYRSAFKAGRLGGVHTSVVDEAYAIAADELQARATAQRRRARWWGLAVLVWLVGSITFVWVAAGPLNLNPSRTPGQWVWFPAWVLVMNMAERYTAANAYRDSAWLLGRPTPPAQPNRTIEP